MVQLRTSDSLAMPPAVVRTTRHTAVLTLVVLCVCSDDRGAQGMNEAPMIASSPDGASLTISAGSGGSCELVSGDGSLVTVSEIVAALGELKQLRAEVAALRVELNESRAKPVGGTASTAGLSCKQIYEVNTATGAVSASGTFWIKPPGATSALQVFCDMTTKAKDGGSGWTLCGKYDRDREEGSQWLGQGFARKLAGAAAMRTVADFSDVGPFRWGSIDCRPLISTQSSGATFMMHAAADVPGSPAVWHKEGMVQFTNIMSDVRENSTNLFDINLDDKGTCVSRDSGGILTYSSNWSLYTANRLCPWGWVNTCDVGGCLSGDAHHFCSSGRDGQRFSNGGGANCEGSGADTIYWAWTSDSHNCGHHNSQNDEFAALSVIGTGCNEVPATYRYNFLLIR